MIIIVFRHSYNFGMKSNAGVMLANGGIAHLSKIFSRGITRTAVPLFFSISGYLFFLKMEGSIDEFFLKFKKE